MNKYCCFVPIIATMLLSLIPAAFCAPEGKLIEEKIDGITVLVYVPGDYDPAKKKYPLIVGCHGGGQSGKEIYFAWHKAADERGYIIAAPNFDEYDKQKEVKLGNFMLDVVKEIRSVYRIDSTRIVLVGNSSGASVCYGVGLFYPEVFTAIAPCSGHSSYLKNFPWKPGLKKVPVYILHGENDPYHPLEELYKEEEKLKRCGYDVKVHVNKNLGHAYPNALNTPVPDWIDRGFK